MLAWNLSLSYPRRSGNRKADGLGYPIELASRVFCLFTVAAFLGRCCPGVGLRFAHDLLEAVARLAKSSRDFDLDLPLSSLVCVSNVLCRDDFQRWTFGSYVLSCCLERFWIVIGRRVFPPHRRTLGSGCPRINAFEFHYWNQKRKIAIICLSLVAVCSHR